VGLHPYWSKDGKIASLNAMSEGVADKSMFRRALRKRRCLVPAGGLYECLKKERCTSVCGPAGGSLPRVLKFVPQQLREATA
jgi:putative SOS response-associated peptidase YedK